MGRVYFICLLLFRGDLIIQTAEMSQFKHAVFI